MRLANERFAWRAGRCLAGVKGFCFQVWLHMPIDSITSISYLTEDSLEM